MKKIVVVLIVILSLLILGQGCVKKESKPVGGVPGGTLPAENINGNVNDVGQGISDIDNIGNEINTSDFDNIEKDLNNINW